MGESAEEREKREEKERKLKYWEVLVKAKYDKESSYERLIVYLAVGAISVLIALMYKAGSIDKCYIFWGGGALVGALIFALSGIFFSIISHEKVLERKPSRIALPIRAYDKVLEKKDDHKNLWGKFASCFFWIAHALLVLGIIVLSLLIYSNLGVKK